MKIPIILLSLMTTIIQAHSQDILGKWYGIGENHLAELVISNDSIKTQILDSSRSEVGHERQNIKHCGIYNIRDKKIIVIGRRTNNNDLQYFAMTFFNFHKNSSIELAANGQTKATKTIQELLENIDKDTTTLLGNVWYREERVKELENLKDLETMPIEDFKLYLKKFIEKRNQYSYMESFMPGTFRDQIINVTLIELGYNPVNRADWENRFFEKYLSEDEVGEIYKEKF